MDKIIVFGKGTYWKTKKKGLLLNKDIVAIVDNKVMDDSIEYEGKIPIYNPSYLLNCPQYEIYIMVSNFWDIATQLLRMGVCESRIQFGREILPNFDESEILFTKYGYKIGIENGKIILYGNQHRYAIDSISSYKTVVRSIISERDLLYQQIVNMEPAPLSRRFGTGHGQPIDRYYIENFLENNAQYVTGDVLEVADNTYTYRYGHNLNKISALHVNGWGENAFKANLETGEGIVENAYDCFICTQTIQFIYNMQAVVDNIYKLLKPGGVAFVSATGNSYMSMGDYNNWGEYWKFTDKSIRKLFERKFGEKVQVNAYGNAKIALGIMYGLCQEDFSKDDLDTYDNQFQLMLMVKVIK